MFNNPVEGGDEGSPMVGAIQSRGHSESARGCGVKHISK